MKEAELLDGVNGKLLSTISMLKSSIKKEDVNDKLIRSLVDTRTILMLFDDFINNLMSDNRIVFNVREEEREQEFKEIDDIDGVSLQDKKITLPIARELKDITPALYWFEGDKYHKSGVYISLCKGFYAKIPFPDVIGTNGKHPKNNTIRCKFPNKEICSKNGAYNCLYVHKGEKFNKLCNGYRCKNETFGCHKTIKEDIEKATHFDIKHILMYSLSDDLLSVLWFQNDFKKGKELLFSNLDIY
jgi:hypothetical protein